MLIVVVMIVNFIINVIKTLNKGDMKMEYEYKHSKLITIGMIGLICTVIGSIVLTNFYNVYGFEAGMTVAFVGLTFGVLIMVGLLNEM